MKKGEYQKYLQSATWQITRQRRLVVAGGQCEFRECLDDHPKYARYGERCTAARDLQVHHRRYDTLGAERDCDLEVLCRFHHLVRHVTTQECIYCSENVETDDDIAIDIVKDAIAAVGGNISNVTLDDVCQHNLCTHCMDSE